jgi:DNA-directed RNA polymerase subunit RPC12/RpoP
MTTKKCFCEHTDYQPGDDWKCPECGGTAIFVEESPNMECELLHPDDEIACENCGADFSGEEIAEKLGGKTVKCTHCNGTGWIENEK